MDPARRGVELQEVGVTGDFRADRWDDPEELVLEDRREAGDRVEDADHDHHEPGEECHPIASRWAPCPTWTCAPLFPTLPLITRPRRPVSRTSRHVDEIARRRAQHHPHG
jgi:hypothetical protein